MTAPVSLAEMRKLAEKTCPCCYPTLSRGDLLALVELAEAYLAVRDDSPEVVYSGETQEQRAKRARLVLAAKGVRP